MYTYCIHRIITAPIFVVTYLLSAALSLFLLDINAASKYAGMARTIVKDFVEAIKSTITSVFKLIPALLSSALNIPFRTGHNIEYLFGKKQQQPAGNDAPVPSC